jgi:hypothetical protein
LIRASNIACCLTSADHVVLRRSRGLSGTHSSSIVPFEAPLTQCHSCG